MKTLLYMAISANGMITGQDDDTSWVSEEDFRGQEKIAKEVGNIIYGKRTYDIGMEEKNLPVPGCLNIVLTHEAGNYENINRFLFLDQSPEKIAETLSYEGFDKMLVAGGSIVNNLFLEAGMVDEIYLDVEPILLGIGKPLFLETDLKVNLELLELNKLSDNTVQLHYAVKK